MENLTTTRDKIRYWDNMDDMAIKFVKSVARKSTSKISDADIEECALDIAKEILEVALARLESVGGEFPVITENY